MNKFTKTLYIAAIILFFYQVVLHSIINTDFANNAILYLFSFIALVSTGLMIRCIKQNISLDYMEKHYKNPILLALLIIGLIAIAYFWHKDKIVSPYNLALLVYFLVSLLYVIESRIAALFAILFLGYCAVFFMLGYSEPAEQFAIYVYYFLVITVILQIREYRLSPDTPNCHSREGGNPEQDS